MPTRSLAREGTGLRTEWRERIRRYERGTCRPGTHWGNEEEEVDVKRRGGRRESGGDHVTIAPIRFLIS